MKEFKCSNCDKHLAAVIDYDFPFNRNIVFTCPWCFDRSFQQEIRGKYSIHIDDNVDILDAADDGEPDSLIVIYLTEKTYD